MFSFLLKKYTKHENINKNKVPYFCAYASYIHGCLVVFLIERMWCQKKNVKNEIGQTWKKLRKKCGGKKRENVKMNG